ncbi:MAG TPA: hypothetical protein PLA68_02125 [Panacibacter sp.]|nr:hypothetical protein [Panacibacter sp.]
MQAANLNRYAELYVDCFMGHGLDEEGGNFSISGDMEAVQRYISKRGAVFFQAIMLYNDSHSGEPPPFGHTGHSFFSGCVNERKCGDTGTNPCGADAATDC